MVNALLAIGALTLPSACMTLMFGNSQGKLTLTGLDCSSIELHMCSRPAGELLARTKRSSAAVLNLPRYCRHEYHQD